jgi:septal ring factor EnvC (AmiA/AmiB activator)
VSPAQDPKNGEAARRALEARILELERDIARAEAELAKYVAEIKKYDEAIQFGEAGLAQRQDLTIAQRAAVVAILADTRSRRSLAETWRQTWERHISTNRDLIVRCRQELILLPGGHVPGAGPLVP